MLVESITEIMLGQPAEAVKRKVKKTAARRRMGVGACQFAPRVPVAQCARELKYRRRPTGMAQNGQDRSQDMRIKTYSIIPAAGSVAKAKITLPVPGLLAMIEAAFSCHLGAYETGRSRLKHLSWVHSSIPCRRKRA